MQKRKPLLDNNKNIKKEMIVGEKVKGNMVEKNIAKELHNIWKGFHDEKKSVDGEALTILFKMRDGNIYFNAESNLGFGFYPIPQNLLFFFFDVLPNKKLKCVDFRGLHITENMEHDLTKAIELSKILKYDKDKNNDFEFEKSYQ